MVGDAYGWSVDDATLVSRDAVRTWTFRADVAGGDPVFLKLRAAADPARLAVCAWLAEHGLRGVVAPLRTISGELSVVAAGLVVAAYPFIDGTLAGDAHLTDAQWSAYGAIVSGVHRTSLPSELEAALPVEQFQPEPLARLAVLDTIVGDAARRTHDVTARETVALWRAHRAEIEALATRTALLAGTLRARRPRDAGVLCHGDIHTYNVLIDRHAMLHVIDWDDLIIAPPERDLMFVLGSPIGGSRSEQDIKSFLEGYGSQRIDPQRLAYYHVEWALQDVVGYAADALSEASGSASRSVALGILRGLFDPGGEVDIGLRATPGLNGVRFQPAFSRPLEAS